MDDPSTLARFQFALTIGFHYIFPPLSIGLGLFLVIFEGIWLKTGKELYHRVAKFWTKIFAIIFALGVASGIVMEFQFGTNWAAYSRYVGDIFGSALAAEGIFAFFLESGFLALLLFGWDRVGRKLHFFSSCMVCLGAHFSAVWIIVANSWMQTPAGYQIVQNGDKMRAEITDFWAMVFNPSSMDRLSHTLSGCWLAGATLVLSVSAYYLLKKRHQAAAKAGVKVALIVGLCASLMMAYTGDVSSKGVAVNQPSKFAAIEAVYETQKEAPLHIIGWLDSDTGEWSGISLPGWTSLLAFGDSQAVVQGLNDIPKDERPPVLPVFWAYRVMVGVGILLLGLFVLGIWGWKRGWLWHNKFVLSLCVLSVLGPQLANQIGWVVAELGRQPWIVYGLMKTKDAISANVGAPVIMGSIIMFTCIYFLLLALFIYQLTYKIHHGPDEPDEVDTGHGKQQVPFINN